MARLFKNIFKILPSFIKIKAYRMLGAKIGRGFKMGYGSFINVKLLKNISIGENVSLGKHVKIESKKLVIGNDIEIGNHVNISARQFVTIGDESVIGNNTTIGGMQFHDSSFFMGKRVHVYQDCFLNTSKPLTLEDGVGVGGGTYIFTHGSWQNAYEGFPFAFAPVTIKKNAWLPWRVFVMPGVIIGENATIGSDALVGKDIPARSFAVGVPAKVIKSNHEYIKEMNELQKLQLMNEIFADYKLYVKEFDGQEAKIETNNHIIELIMQNNFRICYDLNEKSNTNKNRLLLTELNEHDKLEIGVLDLKNKRVHYTTDKSTNDFINYLTSYGIRFDKIGKYA